MRTYEPAAADAVLARLLEEPSMARGVVHHARIPARDADTVPLPSWVDPRIRDALAQQGIASLYTHQADALAAVRAGHDVCVVTPTASGKSLCYELPVLQALADDSSARALWLFPTKALGQDQVAAFRSLAGAAGLAVSTATYDGDTPAPIRSSIRRAGQVVVSNPDMLHAAILPHHTKWFQLFEQVQVIVVDELHQYRGLFGSHVGNVLRRLLRICRHYGSNPVIVTCSATIANPGELATRLTGRAPLVVDRNGAPSGARHVLLVDPPVIDAPSGARGSALTLAQRWALPFLRAGRQTIVFGRSRTGVELILTGLREALREHGGPRTRVRGYRGGYLPTERRSIEEGLRDGEVLGVVSTNALELGVDIGRLDVAVLAGYPGSIAATWQQIGRAGRRRDASVAILVASSAPVDQYVVHHPEFLLDRPPEEARVDPDNLHVLLAHLKAAAFELPFTPGEAFGPGPADDLLAFLGEDGHVHAGDDGRWYWASPDNFPASSISLRTAAEENVVIIDTTPDRPKVIGELDLFSAQTQVHEDAIYLHESAQFHVDRLDWDERKAYVRRVDVDHYTQAELAVTLKPLDVFAAAEAPGGKCCHGEVMVASRATIYKKLKFVTNENVGWGKIHLPELELQTTAYWATLDSAATGWRRAELDVALAGTGRALQAVACVLLMVDPHDLGLVAQVRSPHAEAPTIYLYEAVPGGVGLAERLWARHAELVAGAADLVAACGCESGCPSCTGPRPPGDDAGLDAKDLVLRLLAALGAAGAADSQGEIPSPRVHVGRAMSTTALLERRLAALRAARSATPAPPRRAAVCTGRQAGAARAERLAAAVGGEWLRGPVGHVVRVEPETIALPLERPRLASLPGQPPADARLLCLDTETTGLGTAAGTLAFLIGLGWWEGDRFRQVQLLCPDHADEVALLAAVEASIPPDAWLVTYNGRGFDWPLLVTRYRLIRRAAPAHAGMLDLLPHVRRIFRHRLGDARLATVERELLGVRRDFDVGGWEIPERYLAFVRGGSAAPLAPVVTHNAEDVRSLGRLLVHLDQRYADPDQRRLAPAGDLMALARGYSRERRHDPALACLDEADAGWRPPVGGSDAWPFGVASPVVTVSRERIRAERARTLRRLGRSGEAVAAWLVIAVAGGPGAANAWVEVAKIREHTLADHAGALAATEAAERAAECSRPLGQPLPALRSALAHRRQRLGARLRGTRDGPGPEDAGTRPW